MLFVCFNQKGVLLSPNQEEFRSCVCSIPANSGIEACIGRSRMLQCCSKDPFLMTDPFLDRIKKSL